MSVKHQAFPKVRSVNTLQSHPLVELYGMMTWWERISSAIVIVATVASFIVLVLLLGGQV